MFSDLWFIFIIICFIAMGTKDRFFYRLLACLIGWLPLDVWTQEADYTTWAKMKVEYKVRKRLDVSTGLEWRTKNNLSMTDRWGLDVEAKYYLLPCLKIGTGYEIHYRNRGEEGWKFRHRYHMDGTVSGQWLRWKFSLRERFQHTFNSEEKEFRLRSRLKMAYDIARCKLEPYVSVEMYNGLGKSEHFDIKRMRYRGGVSFPLAESWEAEAFYCRQWEADARKNIFGVECIYKF